MTGILLLLLALSTVDGLDLYEVKAGENVTLQWDIPRTELSSIHMVCLFKPTVAPLRQVFDMAEGVETTEQQDSQFSGRVLCDREGLTRGQVQLVLTGLGPQDSGDYTCEIALDQEKVMSVDFLINVTTPSDSAVETPVREQRNEDSNNQKDIQKPQNNFLLQNTLIIVSVVCIITGVIIKFNKHYRERKQRRAVNCCCKWTTQCLSKRVDPFFSVELPEVSTLLSLG